MKAIFKFLVWVAVFAGIIFVIGWAFLFEIHEAEDNSMAPNIIQGDKFLVYLHADLTSGTPVVCEHPNKSDTRVVGRIVAEGGDRVGFNRSTLSINGDNIETTVEGEYVLVDDRNTGTLQTVQLQERIETLGMIRYRIVWPKRSSRSSRRRNMREKSVRDDNFFLLADNRAFGVDSRVYGQVKISSCIGRPLLIYHPAESNGDAGNETRWFNIIR